MKKIVTLGEIMLRLEPQGHLRFLQADSFGAVYGGGEANVAVSLANFGMGSTYVTKLPANDIGQAAVNSLRGFGVDTSQIIRGGDRIGIYFIEKGASQRPSKVIYDRAGSAIAAAQPSEFNWKEIMKGADWFHFTGITPALSESAAAICLDACRETKKNGMTVSCDLNYRNKLWTKAEANRVMSELCKYVDVCIANEEDAKNVFNIEAAATDIQAGRLNEDGYRSVAKQLTDAFGFKAVAISLRQSLSASRNIWSCMLYKDSECYFSRKYDISIIDRVGGGDSFGAGLIYALCTGKDDQDAIEFAAAASCLKHTIEGDFNMVSVSEVENLSGGDGSGRVQR